MSWIAASLLVLGLALAAGFTWYERTHPSARVLALIATLAALAALGRIAFAPLPNVKPTTDIVLIAGFVLGGAPGFVVGATAALTSNLFFGQGPWTPWQMVAWGLVGAGGALLARFARGRTLGRWPLAIACGTAGLLYNLLLDLHLWVNYGGDHSLARLEAILIAGIPFDLAHVIGNIVFCLAFGPALLRALGRFRARFEIEWLPPAAPAAPAAAALLAALVVAFGATQDAAAAVPKGPVAYLLKAQNADGGFPGTPGQSSTQLHTGWAALGLAAARRNPLDARKSGNTPLTFMAARGKELGDLGELSRTILVLEASGRDARSFGGRDLVKELLSKRRPDGSFAGRVNTTAFAVFALRAAGRATGDRTVRAAARWIAGQANEDGGFNFDGKGGASGVDDTAAALQALAAAGRRGTPTVRRGGSFLVRRQNRDGGFPLAPGGASNAQSTAFAVQALIAAGREPTGIRRGGRDPLAYLRSLIGPDGAVRYSRSSTQTPVWVTAQALLAFARTPFPLPEAPRRARATRRTAPKPAATPARTPQPTRTPEPRATSTATAAAPAPATRLGTGDLAPQARAAGVAAALAASFIGVV